MHEDEIIWVASSNIFYKDGIEVNIKVKEKYRRKKIATVLTAKLILDCLKVNKKISWDCYQYEFSSTSSKIGV